MTQIYRRALGRNYLELGGNGGDRVKVSGSHIWEGEALSMCEHQDLGTAAITSPRQERR